MNNIFRKDELISAFDIEADVIKLAQIKLSDGQRLLHRLTAVKAASSGTDDLAKSIRGINAQFKISKSLVLVNLPRHMVTVRELNLPATHHEELVGMVDLQSSKLLPYPKEEIVYSFKVMETTREGYSRVMLVLTHRNAINKITQVFNKSGVVIDRIALSSEALSVWYLTRKSQVSQGAPVALIEIDSTSADIQIARSGRIEFTRAITFSPETKMQRLTDEIRRSFLTYKKESKPDISKLVLTGSGSIVNREAPILKKEFGLPTIFVNPIKAWPVDMDNLMPTEDQRSLISFTTVLAVAFNFGSLDLNLLPAGIQKARAGKLVKDTLLITGVLSLCIVLGVAGLIWKKMDDKASYLRYVDAEIRKADPRAEELIDMINNIKIVKDQLDMKGTSIDVVRELYKLIPRNISLTILDFEEGKNCTLRGTSDELSRVFDFVSILEGSPYFTKVNVRYATKRAIRKKVLTDFEIICQLAEEGSDIE